MSSHSAAHHLLNESFVEIYFDKEANTIVASWKGFLTVEQVKTGCSFLTDYIIKHKLSSHLSDHTGLRILSKDVQEYLTGTWFNEVEKAGIRKIAVKIAADVFTQATVQTVNTKQQYGAMAIETFRSTADALNWLKA
jgi:hypothetical protein